MASFDTLQKLAEHPEWIAPRSDVRVFLGEPCAPEATKTTVEPGNVFSPGMRTFGVTWWLRLPASGSFFATEIAPLDALKWQFEEGHLPLIHCDVATGGLAIRHSLFQDGCAAEHSEAVCGQLQLTNTRAEPVTVELFVALRSLGPAGGPVRDLKVGPDGSSLYLVERDLPVLGLDRAPSAIGCGVGDPSPAAREGKVPADQAVGDPDGWCFGLARYDVTLRPSETWKLHLDCPQQTYGPFQKELPCTVAPHPGRFQARAEAYLQTWRERLAHLDLQVPDERFRDAFFANLEHILIAMVGDQVRISTLHYPLVWLRDGVYMMRALDQGGFHAEARGATEYCARNDFFGGFGAEGDAPGEGIWALVEHYRLTRDRAWLEKVYPAIRRKCEWIHRMRRAEEPLQVVTDNPVLSFAHAERALGLICMPGRDGIIQGTMDHHLALSWVNHWSIGGLREAAYAARELGHEPDAMAYGAEAESLKQALRAFVKKTPAFFEWERTPNSLVWPSRAWEEDPEAVAAGWDAWWAKHRGDGDAYQPEPYWLYFESGQAHNGLRLGRRSQAWRVVQHLLAHQDAPGLYGYREGAHGVGMENIWAGVALVHNLRGCQKVDFAAPHNWSQSELFLLQRAMLVEEWQGELLLFAGVPPEWLKPGARIAFRGFPSWYGRATGELVVDARGRSAAVALSGVDPGTRVRVRLPQREVTAMADEAGKLSLRAALTAGPEG